MLKRNTFIVSSVVLSSFVLLACASRLKLADISTTANPQEEITKLDQDLLKAAADNVDVLASKEFKESVSWLDEAKSDQESKQRQEEILDDVRKARGYLETAYQISRERGEKAPGLFESRKAALKAGSASHAELKHDLQKLDSDVSSQAADMTNVDAEEIAVLQERYMTLERRATILSQLGASRAMTNGARKEGAKKYAPMTLKKAEISLKNAESEISANVRNAAGYEHAVAVANADASTLNEVMATINQNGGNLPESAALQIVAQKGQITTLNKNLVVSNTSSTLKHSALTERNQDLNAKLMDKTQDLNAANAHVEIQRAIEAARVQFSPEEAEAYQQGDSLLIRLKQVNFSSGRSDLPESSLNLLAKVSKVAKMMRASEIKVEGHTDSMGGENMNKTISEKRASTVAAYFRSNGFKDVISEGQGFQKPISTNKSKSGRAQNRRVDIIITPDLAAAI